jgi:hypothetical protein
MAATDTGIDTETDTDKDTDRHTYSHNLPLYINLLTPWNTVLEYLIGFQLVKKFHAFYGTRKFITAFTSASHLSLN